MAKSKNQKIIKDGDNNEVVMIRTNKRLKEMMSIKEGSRWDAIYWHFGLRNIIDVVKNKPHCSLADIIDEKESGVGYVGKTDYRNNGSVACVKIANILFTGIDIHNADTTSVNSRMYSKDKVLNEGDLVFVRTGATIGKNAITTEQVSGSLVLDSWKICIDSNKINPYYLVVFLKTKYGKAQLEILKNGTGVDHLNIKEIKAIICPKLSEKIQDNIENQYIEMNNYHEEAMKAKEEGNNEKYQDKFKKAEKKLKNLISKTEAVIRGERDDVV